jgi:transcriptional regulator with XRE-family HTH domain
MATTAGKLARYIAGRRHEQRLTVAEAARRANLSDTLWYQLEDGAKSTFRDSTLVKVAAGLDVPAREVFEAAGRPAPLSSRDEPDASYRSDRPLDEDEVSRQLEQIRELADQIERSLLARDPGRPRTHRDGPAGGSLGR